MTARLEFRTFGAFAVLRDGAPAALPPSRKTRALLAYLALAGRPRRRERLCEMFWEIPDDPRAALRWSLTKIRRALDGEDARLAPDRATVAFEASGVEIDLSLLTSLDESALAEGPLDRLEQAAELAAGRFLEDLALDRCPEFEASRTALAFEAETRLARLLGALVGRLAEDPGRALPHAERLAALAPEDPALARRVAELRAAVRERVAAETLPPPSCAAPRPPCGPIFPLRRRPRRPLSPPRTPRRTPFSAPRRPLPTPVFPPRLRLRAPLFPP